MLGTSVKGKFTTGLKISDHMFHRMAEEILVVDMSESQPCIESFCFWLILINYQSGNMGRIFLPGHSYDYVIHL